LGEAAGAALDVRPGSAGRSSLCRLDQVLDEVRHFHRSKQSRDRCYDFLNIFAETFGDKIGVLYTKQSKLLKKLIIPLVFEKNANFFTEDWQKSQKIVIITSTPDLI
jgi:hypothetical protein